MPFSKGKEPLEASSHNDINALQSIPAGGTIGRGSSMKLYQTASQYVPPLSLYKLEKSIFIKSIFMAAPKPRKNYNEMTTFYKMFSLQLHNIHLSSPEGLRRIAYQDTCEPFYKLTELEILAIEKAPLFKYYKSIKDANLVGLSDELFCATLISLTAHGYLVQDIIREYSNKELLEIFKQSLSIDKILFNLLKAALMTMAVRNEARFIELHEQVTSLIPQESEITVNSNSESQSQKNIRDGLKTLFFATKYTLTEENAPEYLKYLSSLTRQDCNKELLKIHQLYPGNLKILVNACSNSETQTPEWLLAIIRDTFFDVYYHPENQLGKAY